MCDIFIKNSSRHITDGLKKTWANIVQVIDAVGDRPLSEPIMA